MKCIKIVWYSLPHYANSMTFLFAKNPFLCWQNWEIWRGEFDNVSCSIMVMLWAEYFAQSYPTNKPWMITAISSSMHYIPNWSYGMLSHLSNIYSFKILQIISQLLDFPKRKTRKEIRYTMHSLQHKAKLHERLHRIRQNCIIPSNIYDFFVYRMQHSIRTCIHKCNCKWKVARCLHYNTTKPIHFLNSMCTTFVECKCTPFTLLGFSRWFYF